MIVSLRWTKWLSRRTAPLLSPPPPSAEIGRDLSDADAPPGASGHDPGQAPELLRTGTDRGLARRIGSWARTPARSPRHDRGDPAPPPGGRRPSRPAHPGRVRAPAPGRPGLPHPPGGCHPPNDAPSNGCSDEPGASVRTEPETLRTLELADFLLIAEAVLEVPARRIAEESSLHLADSALHSPLACFGGEDFYPRFAEKAAVLCAHLVKNHPLKDGDAPVALITPTIEFCHRNGHPWRTPPGNEDGRGDGHPSPGRGRVAAYRRPSRPGRLDHRRLSPIGPGA